MSTERVRIVDIARELGLSKTTVSDALQGQGRVSPATYATVRAAAERLGYVTNRAARQLRGRSVGAFGLYIPPVVRNFSFYMEFAFGAAHGAAAADVDLTLFARDAELSSSRPFQVDGAIAVDPLVGDLTVSRLLAAKIAVVTAGRHAVADQGVRGVIEAQHSLLARETFEHLAASGHTHPAFLSSDQKFFSSWAGDVLEAYLGWCAERKIEPHVREISVVASGDDLAAAVSELVSREGVDSLVCGPQGFAARALPVLESLGHPIGAGFALASLIGDPVTELKNGLITSVDMDPWTFGKEAAELLAEVLHTETDAPLIRTHLATLIRARV